MQEHLSPGRTVYLPTWKVDFLCFFVGLYTSPMDGIGKYTVYHLFNLNCIAALTGFNQVDGNVARKKSKGWEFRSCIFHILGARTLGSQPWPRTCAERSAFGYGQTGE